MKKFLIIVGVIIVVVSIILLCLYLISRRLPFYSTIFGATFSRQYAIDLGLNWQETYLAILDDLQIKKIRIPARWNEIEQTRGKMDFSNLDWQINEAGKRGVEIILAFGRKVPRWPECHDPVWLKNLSLSDQHQQTLEMIKKTVEHYKNSPAIKTWQVENEPLVGWFGINCPKPDREFLKKEIALVRSLDSRPILLTDSGELGLWGRSAGLGDLFGTTLYRLVWNRYIGYWKYWFLPPDFYRIRAILAKKPMNQMMVAELQAEPWFALSPADLPNSSLLPPLDEQTKSMNGKQLRENINYTKRVGFPEAYFWGVEWWYWLKLKGDASVWEAGKAAIVE